MVYRDGTMRYLYEFDFKFNLDLRSGYVRCHNRGDLVNTPDGDIALTESYSEYLLQRIIIWLATPKGEVPNDPDVGCVLHDFLFYKQTPQNLYRLAKELEYDAKVQFPDLGILYIDVKGLSISSIQIVIYTQNELISLILEESEYQELLNEVINMLSIGEEP